MPLDAQVLLAAERSAGGDLGHPDRTLGHAQDRGDLPSVIPGALALREDPHRGSRPPPGRGRNRQGGLGLEERVLDPLGLEGLGRHVGGGANAASTSPRRMTHVDRRLPAAWTSASSARAAAVSITGSSTSYSTSTSAAAARARLTRRCGDGRQRIADVARRLALGHEQRPVRDQQALDPLARARRAR